MTDRPSALLAILERPDPSTEFALHRCDEDRGIMATTRACSRLIVLYTPTLRFVGGFASLVENPKIRRGVLTLIFARPTVTGRFKDRAVVLQMVQPRRRRAGYVVLSMKTDAPDGAPWKDSLLTSQDGDISRATFDLEGRYELVLTLDDGWLRAKWTPSSWRFPGQFDPDRWRKTLAQMQVLVEWAEKRQRR